MFHASVITYETLNDTYRRVYPVDADSIINVMKL